MTRLGVSARCPVCDALVKISPTDKKLHPDWSSKYWRVDMHVHQGRICDGSGELV